MSVRHNPGVSLPPLSTLTTQVTQASPGTSLSSGAAANVVSQALNAGTYLIWGVVDFALSGLTASSFTAGLSLTSATLPTQPGGAGLGPDPLANLPLALSLITTTVVVSTPPTILTLAAAATLYLVARSNFTLGSLTAFGTMSIIQLS